MIEFKLSELAAAAHTGVRGSDLTVTRVSTDSRDCQGALFIALKGERFDGHDYVDSAVRGGAVALGVSRPLGTACAVPVIECQDTQRLLGLSGLLVRQKCPAKVAALTGSCGKTTVKELTCAILSALGPTVATAGNFNNDVGVPLTLLRLQQDTQYAVIEQGASHLRDIARTCEFVRSDCALINNAGAAHIEGFGSREGVYRGKSEILDDVLSRGGTGIVPTDSPWYERWLSDYASAFSQGRMLTFGRSERAQVRVLDESSDPKGVSFTLKTPAGEFSARLNLIGAHNVLNAAAACALSLCCGADTAAMRQGLISSRTLSGRLVVEEFDDFTLIDDAYNASFNAVQSALDVLSVMNPKRVLVFGDMGELGEEALSLHRLVGEYARGRCDEVWGIGPLCEETCRAFGTAGRHFKSAADLVQYAQTRIGEHTHLTLLVKGSHAMHMDEICRDLGRLGVRS